MRPSAELLLTVILALGAATSPVLAQRDNDAELRGDIISAATGEPIAGAWIALEGWGFGTYSRRDGRFRLPDTPHGPRRYDVAALGYLPSIVTLDADSSDLAIELDPDESLQPGLALVFELLDARHRGGRVFDRQALAFSGAFDLGEFLTSRGVRGIRKFCLDERSTPGLSGALPEDFYLMEIHGSTARLYSEEFLQETAARDPQAIRRIIDVYQPVC